ncbi:MAG: acetyl-CoA C-acyltransferase [Clostridia bacterium]|nr:acetyl-CoA C-acyltransferase [Clostridia bacterium]
MPDVVIVEPIRTAVGRYRGALAPVRPDDLAAHVLRAVVDRTGIDPGAVEDVYLGCANQAGEDNRNVARMAVLLAGLPETVAGCTVNRLCGSGLEAILQAARAVRAGEGDLFLAGGVESMTRAPYVLPKPEDAFARGDRTLYDTTLGWRMTNPRFPHPFFSMGETGENVAERLGIAREDQDRFALASQMKWKAAQEAGRFRDEIVPVDVPQRKGPPVRFEVDEHPRPDTTLEALARLRPAFREGGTVTAGNSSGINDGAAACLVTTPERARELGLRPFARLLSAAVAGVDPDVMGLGPIPATRKALARAGLQIDDIDLVEINEAFASQALACLWELGLDPLGRDYDRVNPNGGAIAIGHPLGATGARIVATLLHEMRRRGARRGLATMCIGVGQGITAVFEAVE